MQSSGRVNKVHDHKKRFDDDDEMQKNNHRLNYRKATEKKKLHKMEAWEDDDIIFDDLSPE